MSAGLFTEVSPARGGGEETVATGSPEGREEVAAMCMDGWVDGWMDGRIPSSPSALVRHY